MQEGCGALSASEQMYSLYGIRKIRRFLKPYCLPIIFGPLLMVVEVVMDLYQPRLTQVILDSGVAKGDMSVVLHMGLLMLAAAFVGFLGGAGNTVLGVHVAQGFGADLRGALYKKLQSLSYRNFDSLGTGGTITRLTNDVTQVQEAVLMFLRVMVRAPLMLVGSVVMAMITSPKLSPILFIMIPILLVLIVVFFSKAHPLFMGVQGKLDRLNTVSQESITGVRLVRAFIREDYEEERFGGANSDLTQVTTRAMQFVSVVMPVVMLILNFATVGALWLGGISVVHGDLQVGQLVAFINYLTRALMSLVMASTMLIQASRAGASAARIAELLDVTPDISDPEDAVSLPGVSGSVEFDGVSFSYEHSESPAVCDASFRVRAGETVAVVGATGSGKSSLVSLIPRFYDVDAGRVMVDGVDVRALRQEDLRKEIGMVFQESMLFSGTIAENIAYGRPDAGDGEIAAAASAAQIADFIESLPDGYNSVVGQQGVNLSGGQKQRIALARALITHPKILILDDCTSAVDTDTEARIISALHTLSDGPTIFLITQRISTVLQADRVLVLDNGHIVGDGSHESLLAGSPIYRDICKSQLGDEL